MKSSWKEILHYRICTPNQIKTILLLNFKDKNIKIYKNSVLAMERHMPSVKFVILPCSALMDSLIEVLCKTKIKSC